MLGIGMAVRLLLFAALVLLAVVVFRRLGPRLAANPRLRYLLSGVGLQVLRIYLLRSVLPLLLRAVRMLRFFR